MATKTKAAEKTTAKQQTAIARRGVRDVVERRVRDLTRAGELRLPRNYNLDNAVKAAWLKIQDVRDKDGRAALDVATPASVQTALLDMCIMGLTPARGQCHFVMYGKKLTCLPDYTGKIAMLKRAYGDETDVFSRAVYEGDVLEHTYDGGVLTIGKHEQKLENIDSDKVTHAYAIAYLGEGRRPHAEIMTMEQIQRAWKMGGAGGTSGAHEEFADEMARKTVVSRLCKVLIRSSDDRYLADVVERQDVLVAEAEIDAEEEEFANRRMITFADEEDEDETESPEGDGAELASNGKAASQGPGF